MSRTRLIRAATATLATIAVSMAVLTALLAANGDPTSYGRSPLFEVAVPMISIAALAGISWLLAVSARAARQSRVVRCAACGGPVFNEWRLCPHCGERLDTECDVT